MWIALSLLSTAHAFCGTYVSRPGDQLINESSRVVVAHDATLGLTTLTLDMDVSGATDDFGVVVPVPAGLDPASVRTVDRGLVDSVMHWAAPRGVAYTCDDEETLRHNVGCKRRTAELGCVSYAISTKADASQVLLEGTNLGAPDSDTLAVTVEHAFAVAEYDLVVLSAESGDDLQTWLTREGFALSEDAADLFDTYLHEDTWFVAARVNVEAPIEDGSWLSPLQLQYEESSDMQTIPIRVGTLSGKGQQEVVVAVLSTGGVPGVATFPDATIDRDCLLPPGTDLDTYYADAVDKAIDDIGGSGWILEHSWPLATKCDPCPPPSAVSPFSLADLADLGLSQEATTWNNPRVSRLRVRYQIDHVLSDLVVYDSGTHDAIQARFISGPPGLESLFPVCDQGFPDHPRECPPPEPAHGATLPLIVFLGPLGFLGIGLRRRP